MGFAIAEEALRRGAGVTLIAGHASVAPPAGARVVRVETAAQMLAACLERAGLVGVFVRAAAVADFTPETVAERKIKKAPSPPTPAGGYPLSPHSLATLGGRGGARKSLSP